MPFSLGYDEGNNTDQYKEMRAWIHAQPALQTSNGMYELGIGETPQEWYARLQDHLGGGKGKWRDNKGVVHDPYGDMLKVVDQAKAHPTFGKWIAGATPGAADPAAAAPGEQSTMQQRLDEFYKRMSAPLDFNDPEVKAAMSIGANTGQKQAAMQGIQGGLAASGVTKMALDSLAPIRSQRNGLAAQALGMSSNYSLGLGTQGENARQFNANMSQANDINARNASKEQDAALIAAGGQAGAGIIKGLKDFGTSSGGATAPAYNPYDVNGTAAYPGAPQGATPQGPGFTPDAYPYPSGGGF